MAIYTGKLKRLGNSHGNGGFKVYSLIEIGDTVLNKVTINNNLDNYLQDGLSSSEPVTIETISNSLTAKGIASVRVGSGKRYVSRPFALGFVITPFIIGLLGALMVSGVNIWFSVFIVAFSLWMLQPAYEYFSVSKTDAIVI